MKIPNGFPDDIDIKIPTGNMGFIVPQGFSNDNFPIHIEGCGNIVPPKNFDINIEDCSPIASRSTYTNVINISEVDMAIFEEKVRRMVSEALNGISTT